MLKNKDPLTADDIVHLWMGVRCFICTLNFQMQHQIKHSIHFKPMTSFFCFHSPPPAKAEMRDAARQVDNAKARRRMYHMSKTKAIKAKARVDIGDAARQEMNAKARKHKPKGRAEMSDVSRQTHKAKVRKYKAKVRADMSDAARHSQEHNAKARNGWRKREPG